MQDNQQDSRDLPMTTQAGQTGYSAQDKQTAVTLINRIFHSLKAIFPAWTAALKDPAIESQARVEWLKGLIEGGINSEKMVDMGLSKCRQSISPFLPSIGQFVEWCRSNGVDHPPMEACYAELTRYIADNRKDRHNLSPILYHTVQRNMDFYRYQKIEKDYDRVREFEMAFKATLFQLECGESLQRAPAPETLIESDRHEQKITPEVIEKTQDIRSSILAMLDDKPEPKPLTAAELADQQRLEKIRNNLK